MLNKSLVNLITMPFKDRTKQLNFLRKYQADKRKKLKELEELEAREKFLIRNIRDKLIMRQTLPIRLITKYSAYSTIRLAFKWCDFDSLLEAIKKGAEEENCILKDKSEILLIQDWRVERINDVQGQVYEVLAS